MVINKVFADKERRNPYRPSAPETVIMRVG